VAFVFALAVLQPESAVAATSPVHAIARINSRGTMRRKRFIRANIRSEVGNISAKATKPPLDVARLVGSSFAMVEAEVRMVSVLTAEVVVGVMVTEEGAKAQLIEAGSEPHEKVTVPE
jgi:hypothetical protein